MISLGRVVLVVPSPKIVINLPGTYRSYLVKENPIGSAVSDVLRYRQTNKQTDRHPVTLLQIYKGGSYAQLNTIKETAIHSRCCYSF